MKVRLFLIFAITVLMFGCEVFRDENYENLKKVKLGMNMNEADSIMICNPKLIEKAYWNDSLIIQYYDSPRGASSDLGIVFNKDSLVVDIMYGD